MVNRAHGNLSANITTVAVEYVEDVMETSSVNIIDVIPNRDLTVTSVGQPGGNVFPAWKTMAVV